MHYGKLTFKIRYNLYLGKEIVTLVLTAKVSNAALDCDACLSLI